MLSVSEYEELAALKEERLRAALQKGMDDLRAGRVTDGDAVLEGLRKRIKDGAL